MIYGGYLKLVPFGGVDDRRAAPGADTGQVCPIIQVHMSVDEPLGLIQVHQIVERLKPLVGLVGAVVEAGCRGMGQQDVCLLYTSMP